MKVIVALVFTFISTACLEDLDGKTYHIQSAVTKKYLYVDHTLDTLNDPGTPRNVSILETANKIPTPKLDAQFLVVRNKAVGPYFNIINLGTNATLYATDTLISYESGSPVYKVMALNNASLINAQEAIWNISTFRNDTYILNVHFRSYLYTSNALNSSAVVEGCCSFPLLLSSEIGGRALGTQWLLVRGDANVEDEGQMDRKDAGKMAEDRASKEIKKRLEEHVDNQQGEIEKEDDTEKGEQLGNVEVVVEEKVVKTDQLGNKKAVEEKESTKKELEQIEIEPGLGEKKVDLKKYEQVEIVPSVEIEKVYDKEDEQGEMESAKEEKIEKNEDDEMETQQWMTPMEPWLREEKLKTNEDKQAQMETAGEEEKVVGVRREQKKTNSGHEDERRVDRVQGEQLQIPPGMDLEEVNRMRYEELERSAMLGWETRARVGNTKVNKVTVDPNDPDFKAFALMFNCRLTTTRSPFTTVPWVIYWPFPYPGSPYVRPRVQRP